MSPQQGAKSFDWQVEHYNKQGQVVRANHYRMVVDSEGKRMERPPGSGKWYSEAGTLIKDESAALEAKRVADEAEVIRLKEEKAESDRKAAEAKAVAERERLKLQLKEELREEMRVEIMEEMKLVKKGPANGPSGKA